MTATESWNALCDLEEAGVPGLAERTVIAASLLWRDLEAGWAAVAQYALARQAEAAQKMASAEGVAK